MKKKIVIMVSVVIGLAIFSCVSAHDNNEEDIARAQIPNSLLPDQNDAIVGLSCGDSAAVIAAINCAKNLIIEEIQECCSLTSTLLEEIIEDIEIVQTTLVECCTTITSILEDIEIDIIDIQTSLTTFCTTILERLDEIEIEIEIVQTTLVECCTTITSILIDIEDDIVDIQTALTTCCTTILERLDDIEIDIEIVQTTLIDCCTTITTMIADLNDCCNTFLLTQEDLGVSGTTLSNPGTYFFAEDLSFSPGGAGTAITIASDGVTIDMCNKTLSLGDASSGVTGIFSSGFSRIVIQNGSIESFTSRAIQLSTVSDALISNINIIGCSSIGILVAVANTIEINKVLASGNTGATFTAIQITNATNAYVHDTVITQNVFSGALTGLITTNCSGVVGDTITVSNNGSTGTPQTVIQAVGFGFGTTASTLKNITIGSNVASSSFTGILLSDAVGSIVDNCVVQENTVTTGGFIGLSLANTTTTSEKTIIQNNTVINNLVQGASVSSLLRGFFFDQVSYAFAINNRALYNSATGDGGTSGNPNFYDNFQVAGFLIGSSNPAVGLGVKESEFIGNSACGNNAFDDARSYGFRVLTPADAVNGNQNNLYLNNIGMRNGPTTPVLINQIISDAALPNGAPGGVPLGSITDGTLAAVNLFAGLPLTNLRLPS